MRLAALISLSCALLLSAQTARTQIKIVPRERLEAVASPKLSSDSSALKFDTYHIVAETMSEDDPPAVYRFEMTNVGKEAITIHRMNTTCSCVTVTCPEKELDPDEKTVLTVRYDPKGHPGVFERKIFVYTQPGTNPSAILKLTAHVERSSDLSRLYQVQMGSIRLRSSEIVFQKGVKARESLNFLNLSGKPLKLECEEMLLPECLSFEAAEVEDGEEGVLTVSYDPQKGDAREKVLLVLKGLGVPPSQSTINIRFE